MERLQIKFKFVRFIYRENPMIDKIYLRIGCNFNTELYCDSMKILISNKENLIRSFLMSAFIVKLKNIFNRVSNSW